MPRYNYECNTCKKKALKKHSDKLVLDNSGDKQLPLELYEELVLFETFHSIDPSAKELEEAKECPRCGKTDCTISLYGAQIASYIRGYGYLDRAGAVRDMHRYKLANDDPYAQYRVPGEVDHIDDTLRKKGQHDPKRQHFMTAKSDTEPKSDKKQK